MNEKAIKKKGLLPNIFDERINIAIIYREKRPPVSYGFSLTGSRMVWGIFI